MLFRSTNIILDISELLETAEENEFYEKPIEIYDNKVIVKLKEKSGYEYDFFNDLKVNLNYQISNNLLILEIK